MMCSSLRPDSISGLAARFLSIDVPRVSLSQSANLLARDRWLNPLQKIVFADGFETPAI